jgi:hypothetical protein
MNIVLFLVGSGTLKNVSDLLSNPQNMVEESWERISGAQDLKVNVF